MERQTVAEETKANTHKVPLFDDFQQLAAVRATRPPAKPAPLPETESTESTPVPSPRPRAEIPDSETWEHLFRIRNLMTGEELDLRDENEETFGQRFAGLINREHASERYEEY